MRKALIIGVDFYKNGNFLSGCVNDAMAMKDALGRNYDLSLNFQCELRLAETMRLSDGSRVGVSAVWHQDLAADIDWLFEGEPEIALFYFSGHGAVFDGKGYLCTSDCVDKYSGVPMLNLIEAAKKSKARNKVIILDCCHSGAAGSDYFGSDVSVLPENTVIMTGCTKDGYSQERNGSGVFTQLFVEALNSAGSNIMGEVSLGNIYAYIDKSLGAFEQRPVFKANVKSFIRMKKNKPLIGMEDLRRLTEFFKKPEDEYPLDPSYEEDKKNLPEGADATRNKKHEELFKILRKYWQSGLIVTTGLEPDQAYMYWAAVLSKGCKLTGMGKHYWNMVKKDVI